MAKTFLMFKTNAFGRPKELQTFRPIASLPQDDLAPETTCPKTIRPIASLPKDDSPPDGHPPPPPPLLPCVCGSYQKAYIT